MSAQELQAELASIKEMLNRLQSTVDRLSVLIETNQSQALSSATHTRWLALAGIGAEVWQDVDVDAYIDEERHALSQPYPSM